MQRTISVMLGKGSVSHNSRVFHAANTNPERSGLNRCYCNDDIKKIYHDLFGEALTRYNEKQTRSDRIITNYYDKICSGKQEKPFHEIILQIGNCDDMGATTANGELASRVLDEYMRTFQSRNPNMRVFSAHLHMDEATPHLHIDFVPFTTGSKRGLDTRVSLKQALAAQGFTGGTRQETEWNQWVLAEKERLASVMDRYDIGWLKKGTREKHLSVLDYEKKVRSEEVGQLEAKVDDVRGRLEQIQKRESLIDLNMGKYDTDPEWQLPEPTRLMTANAYKTKIVEPFIKKLKGVIGSLVSQYLEVKSEIGDLKNRLWRSQASNENLMDRITEGRWENKRLMEIAKDYKHVRNSLGEEKVNEILDREKAGDQIKKRSKQARRDTGR